MAIFEVELSSAAPLLFLTFSKQSLWVTKKFLNISFFFTEETARKRLTLIILKRMLLCLLPVSRICAWLCILILLNVCSIKRQLFIV